MAETQEHQNKQGSEELSTATVVSPDEAASGECPICVMMRQGGCEEQFNKFMDCGIEAEKGDRDYEECIAAFDTLRACMLSNRDAFAAVLGDVESMGSTRAEIPVFGESVLISDSDEQLTETEKETPTASPSSQE